ncbi:phosphatidate cytidylyltransferase [Methanoculleus taiwanensis]|uniref:Phosphatidate cytidylyltransferase n=1 Tax=Methanoculleus taiwanensis TaxID=1550565 RepID=A0A498H0J3_9EURY|nr:phosphatidate cytidylyltransferase [Methanoculleus taiwanensis]RXE56441.1 phosphatidate cytidylyltransferase [Methanoculleus taiwanensis]
MNDEVFRQTVHFLMGVLGAAILITVQPRTALIFLGVVLFIGFAVQDILTRGYRIPALVVLVDEAERRGKVPMKGGIAYAISALLCYTAFGPFYTAIGLVTLGVLDSVSTLVGIRVGKHTLYRKKSVEGTLSGIILTFAILAFFIPPWTALFVAVVAGVVEAFSPIDDNLIIPLATCIVLALCCFTV